MHIVGLSGRKHSGKSELANFLISYNYEVINFADHMKELVSTILGCTIDELNKDKELVSYYDLSNFIKFVSIETNISEEYISPFFSNSFSTIREILQVLGTDIIRKYNPNWHINKTKALMKTEKKYVIGDVRFPNEKEMIESLGGKVYFIIRPDNLNISNHISEVSLRRKDFTNVIINNSSKESLLKRWKQIIRSNITSNIIINNEEQTDLFYYPTSISAYTVGLMMGKQIIIENPLVKEDLKYWNLYEMKTPDIIINNKLEPLINYWILGILDSQEIEDNNLFLIITFKNTKLLNLFKANIPFTLNHFRNKLSISKSTLMNWLSRDVLLMGKKSSWKN